MAFYQCVLTNKPRPQYSWSMEPDGSIRVQSQTPPKQVNLWQANNPKTRDFRVATIGKAYTSSPLKEEGSVYIGKIDPPASGWTAYFVEMVYDVGAQFPLKVTTGVRVLPDKLPHADVDPSTAPLEKRPSAN